MGGSIPKVSIGMPVYNGAGYIADAIESILKQTFTEFELIISDNCSDDGTAEVCDYYSKKDPRIKYIPQSTNLGARANFITVFDESVGEYFMWAAVDDIRSEEFLEANYKFLSFNRDFVSSTSVAKLTSLHSDNDEMGCWELSQPRFSSRLLTFYSSWHANSHFYGMHRRKIVAEWRGLSSEYIPFLGDDWDFCVHMLVNGKMHCDQSATVYIGAAGVCRVTNLYAEHRHSILDDHFPFKGNSIYALKKLFTSEGWTFSELMLLCKQLWKYNRKGMKHRKKIEKYDTECSVLVEQLLVEKINEVVICGAGEIGTRLAAICIKNNINVTAFTDKKANGDQVKLMGCHIPILTLEEGYNNGGLNFLIGAVKYSEQISEELLMLTESEHKKVKVYKLNL